MMVQQASGSNHASSLLSPALGLLVTLGLLASCSLPGSAARAGSAAPPAGANVRQAQRVTATMGWALTDNHLLLTDDGGAHWAPITPANVPAATITGAFFLDPSHGWLVAATPPAPPGDQTQTVASTASLAPTAPVAPTVTAYRTVDGGQSWQASVLPAQRPLFGRYGRTYFAFLTPQEGWIDLDLGSNANFSRGEVFHTADGGSTWSSLAQTIAAPMRFADASDGWLAGGAGGGQFLVTHDGGRSWQSQTAPVPAAYGSDIPVYQLPPVHLGAATLLPVTFERANAPVSDGLGVYRTADGGRSWQFVRDVASPAPDDHWWIPSDLVDATTWVVALPSHQDSGTIAVTADQRQTWTNASPAGLPTTPLELSFASAQAGWALVNRSGCTGYKSQCYSVTELYGTADGGRTWSVFQP